MWHVYQDGCTSVLKAPVGQSGLQSLNVGGGGEILQHLSSAQRLQQPLTIQKFCLILGDWPVHGHCDDHGIDFYAFGLQNDGIMRQQKRLRCQKTLRADY
eukprot:GHUV01013084.1.p1 GENE.GHUV01013084.1~~GHUV01013084.1.p1  ORF type:complete len:100 (+),score=10.11 GHUV01013084.1:584-883(+)